MSGSGSGCLNCDTCLPRLCVTKDESGRVTDLSYWDDSDVLTEVPDCTVSYDCVDGECIEMAGSSGTYDTLEECEEACGAGCCPEVEVPLTLYGRWSDLTGDCVDSCFPSETVTLTYNVDGHSWQSDILGDCSLLHAFFCDSETNQWNFGINCVGTGVVTITRISTQCDPFEVVFAVTVSPDVNCCSSSGGTARFTVTTS